MDFSNPEFDEALKNLPNTPSTDDVESSEDLVALVMRNLTSVMQLETIYKKWTNWVTTQAAMAERMKHLEERSEERIREAVDLERTFNRSDDA